MHSNIHFHSKLKKIIKSHAFIYTFFKKEGNKKKIKFYAFVNAFF